MKHAAFFRTETKFPIALSLPKGSQVRFLCRCQLAPDRVPATLSESKGRLNARGSPPFDTYLNQVPIALSSTDHCSQTTRQFTMPRHSGDPAGPASPQPLIDINPYRGLEAFDEAHAPFFFGRETIVSDLVERLTEQRKQFVAVVGASGSGKSSVVRAGLIPQLRRRRPPNETWDVAVFTPGERPWFRLAAALGPLRFPDKSDTELDIEIERLAKALEADQLSIASAIERIVQPQGTRHRLLLVIDQFEELFTLTPADQRQGFIDRLVASHTTAGLVLVPTLRADFYGQAIEANRHLTEMLALEQVVLGRLSSEELSRAISEPARLARLEFDAGLSRLLLDDAGHEPGNLPLLQHALLELYEHGKHAGRLTFQAYEAIGGMRRAIANTAERQFQRFEQKGEGALVRSVFTQLVCLARPDEGVEDTRRRIAVSALPAAAASIVDEFAGQELRLLVKASEHVAVEGEMPREQQTVEVAHEALIREWNRLKGWLNEDRGFYLWRQRFDLALDEYQRYGSAAELLLQGPALKEAEGKIASSMPEPLSEKQVQFIHASIEARDRLAREQQEAEERRRQEKEELQRRESAALLEAARAATERQRVAERAKRIGWGAAVHCCCSRCSPVSSTSMPRSKESSGAHSRWPTRRARLPMSSAARLCCWPHCLWRFVTRKAGEALPLNC